MAFPPHDLFFRQLFRTLREIICCLTSTEASRPIRDGDERGKGDRRVKTKTKQKTGANPEEQGCRGPPPEQQNVNRQCPSGIAQRPPHHAIAVPTATQNRVTKTMSVAPPLGNN